MNEQAKKKIGICLIALSCILIVSAFVIKQRTIEIEMSIAEEFAQKMGTTVHGAEANLARFEGKHAEADEIMRRGIAGDARKGLQLLKAEEEKQLHFYLLLGAAALAFLTGIIMLAGTKQDMAAS